MDIKLLPTTEKFTEEITSAEGLSKLKNYW
jgi:hypothetical protein